MQKFELKDDTGEILATFQKVGEEIRLDDSDSLSDLYLTRLEARRLGEWLIEQSEKGWD